MPSDVVTARDSTDSPVGNGLPVAIGADALAMPRDGARLRHVRVKD
jgi:hypothetical protein